MSHAALRAWAVEGTGSHGAGLARHLQHARSSWSSWIVPCAQPATVPSPTRWTRSEPPAKRSLGPRVGPPQRREPAGPVEPVRRPEGPRSTAQAMPAVSCSAWSSRPPNRSANGSGARNCRRCSRPRPACGSTPRGMWRPPRLSPCCLPGTTIHALTAEAAEHERDIRPRQDLASRPARPAGHRTDRGSDRALCLGPQPDPLRSRLREARRDAPSQPPAARPTTSPPQPLRRPTPQPRPAHHRPHPAYDTTGHPRLHRPTHHQGKNRREIQRCLKRYIARDLYRLLEAAPTGLDKT